MATDNDQGPEGESVGHRHLNPVPPMSEDIDLWTFESDGKPYDRAEFYTKTVDERGHKETFHTPVTPALHGRVGALVASKEIPKYKTVHAFIRNAIYHQLHYDTERLANPAFRLQMRNWLEREMMQSKREEKLATITQMESAIEAAKALFEKCVSTMYWEGLREGLQEVEEELAMLPEPFKGRMSEVVDHYKKHLTDK